MHRLTLLLLPALAFAQERAMPTPLPADLEALAERVERSHQPDGPVAPITAFRAGMELHLLAADSQQQGQVDLAVQFLLWQRGEQKVSPLLRYQVREAEQPIERGRDRNGYWQLQKGQPRDLDAPDLSQDRAACERHLNLARQLLRCLAPGTVLRQLTSPTPVADEALAIDRATKVPCQTVEGGLAAFPLLQQGGEDAPVQLKVYVTKAEGRLLAVEVWPLRGGQKDLPRGELVRLLDLHPRDGLLVPRKLEYLFRTPQGSTYLHSRAVLTSLSLRPELRAEDFDRPKP